MDSACRFAPKMCLEWCRSSPGLKEPVIGVREVSRHPPTQPKPDVCTCSQSILLRSHSLSPTQDRFGAARGAACGESERGGNDWRLTGGRTGRVWRETFGSNKSIRALFSWVRVWVSCNGQSGLLAGQVCPDTLHLPVTTNSCAPISEVRSTQKSCLCKFWRFFYKRVPR